MKPIERKAAEVTHLIRLFEQQGRVVTGVTLDGKAIHLDFEPVKQDHVNSVDLVRMDD